MNSNRSAAVSKWIQSKCSAVSEINQSQSFQSSFRAVLEQFQSNLTELDSNHAAVPTWIQCSFGAVSVQFSSCQIDTTTTVEPQSSQSDFGAVSVQILAPIDFQSDSAVPLQYQSSHRHCSIQSNATNAMIGQLP